MSSAEDAVLGSCLVQPDAIVEGQALLAPADFEGSQQRHTFEAMLTLASRNTSIDPVTLEDEMRRRGTWPSLGLLVPDGQPTSWLLKIAGDAPLSTRVGQYAEIVARQSALRRLRIVSGEVSALANESPEEAQRLLLESQTLLTQISRGRLRPGVDLADVVEPVAAEFRARQMARDQGGARLTGLSFGLTELDLLTGGARNQTLTIVAARTSLGKTAFGCQVAILGAVYEKVPALMFSLEMGAAELCERLYARVAKVDSQHLRTGKLNEQDWAAITTAGWQMSERGMFVISNTRNLGGIAMEARAFRVKNRGRRILVVVDYLQLARVGGFNHRSREEELAEISGGLKELAVELDCPVLALAQLNRGPDLEDREPRVSDIRGSGSIEQDADLILLIHRPRGAAAGGCEINVAKQRNGGVGKAVALWDGATYQLRDVPDTNTTAPS